MPFNPSAVTPSAIGTGTLTFSDGANGTFTTVSGIRADEADHARGVRSVARLHVRIGDTTRAGDELSGPVVGRACVPVRMGRQFHAAGRRDLRDVVHVRHRRSPLWLSATVNKSSPGAYGNLYRTTGPAFSAVPFNPARSSQRRSARWPYVRQRQRRNVRMSSAVFRRRSRSYGRCFATGYDCQ